jgi:hypothetical protein
VSAYLSSISSSLSVLTQQYLTISDKNNSNSNRNSLSGDIDNASSSDDPGSLQKKAALSIINDKSRLFFLVFPCLYNLHFL